MKNTSSNSNKQKLLTFLNNKNSEELKANIINFVEKCVEENEVEPAFNRGFIPDKNPTESYYIPYFLIK